MSGNAHQRLQADVEGVNAVQYADRVDVVAEMPPGVLHGNLVQKHFARMRKRRMPDVMPQGNRLNQVEIEVQGAADGARNAGYQLHMQAAARYVVIADERKHLRFVRIAVEIRAVHNFIHIMQESWSPDAARITRRGCAADDACIWAENLGACAVLPVAFNPARHFFR